MHVAKFRLALVVAASLILVACAGEVSAERRTVAVELAESLVAPVGFEASAELEVTDPAFGVLGNEPGSIVHEWRAIGEPSTRDVLEAFDAVFIDAGFERVATACTSESLTGFYWHELTGSAVLDRELVDAGSDEVTVFVRLVSSWDEDLPTDEIESVDLGECSS